MSHALTLLSADHVPVEELAAMIRANREFPALVAAPAIVRYVPTLDI